jgi:hypothetical protein
MACEVETARTAAVAKEMTITTVRSESRPFFM